jgi:hypothetical protein
MHVVGHYNESNAASRQATQLCIERTKDLPFCLIIVEVRMPLRVVDAPFSHAGKLLEFTRRSNNSVAG